MTEETKIDQAGDQAALEKLLAIQAKATPVPQKVAPVKDRNAPDRWYARNDGDIVKLQGSPQAIAHYTGKGFHLLTPDEVRDWEQGGVRDAVVAIQNKRAKLISAIRRIAGKKPDEVDLNEAETPLEWFTIEDLEKTLANIRGTSTVALISFSQISPALAYQRKLEEAAERELREGVEVGDAGELAGKRERSLQGKRPGGRTISPGSVSESL